MARPIIDNIERRLVELEKQLNEEYRKRTPKSREMYERALRVLPGGVTYHIRWFSPYPLYIVKASAQHVWDIDGNMYTDYWMGHGAHILGHNPDVVRERVVQILEERGSHLGFENDLAVEYAELLTKIVPSAEMVRYTNSGTEANMYTVRLVRAYTGKKRIVKVNGGWHGAYDALHTAVTPPYWGAESAGLPEENIKYTVGVPFNDLEVVEQHLRKRDIAAVIVEPVLGAGGCIPAEPDYLKGLRELTNQYDALLVFDEVITGFRISLGGAQEYYNVKPDVTVLGKAVGGGYPGSGAIVGIEEVMKLFDHIAISDPRKRSGHSGTFVGNPITIAAGYALASYMYQNKHLYEEFNNLWSWVKEKLSKECNTITPQCFATGLGSMIGIHFTEKEPKRHEDTVKRWSSIPYKVLHLYARLNNVLYLTEHTIHFLPSMAHTKRDAEKLIDVIVQFLSLIGRQ